MDGNNIVELTPSDIKSINNICISYWGEESLYQEDVLTNIISQNLSYGIKILGDLMAFCLMKRVGKQCTIFLIAVKPNYTKKGLGKAILSFCLDNAMNKGLNTFTLHVQDRLYRFWRRKRPDSGYGTGIYRRRKIRYKRKF